MIPAYHVLDKFYRSFNVSARQYSEERRYQQPHKNPIHYEYKNETVAQRNIRVACVNSVVSDHRWRADNTMDAAPLTPWLPSPIAADTRTVYITAKIFLQSSHTTTTTTLTEPVKNNTKDTLGITSYILKPINTI